MNESPDILANFHGFLRARGVLELIPISRTQLWRMVREGRFPKPVKLGPKMTAWRADEVAAWVRAQCKTTPDTA